MRSVGSVRARALVCARLGVWAAGAGRRVLTDEQRCQGLPAASLVLLRRSLVRVEVRSQALSGLVPYHRRRLKGTPRAPCVAWVRVSARARVAAVWIDKNGERKWEHAAAIKSQSHETAASKVHVAERFAWISHVGARLVRWDTTSAVSPFSKPWPDLRAHPQAAWCS